jgi:hypothetical protein
MVWSVKLRPITDPKQVLNEEIRRHALDGSKAAVTRNFVAIEEGREVVRIPGHGDQWLRAIVITIPGGS